MVRFKMYNIHFFQLILLLIFDSVNCNMECDCNTIAAVQEVMQKELFQIKVENSKMASRLRRLEASSKNSKTMNHQHSETVSDMTKDQNPNHDNTRNDVKRIETIESTLARIVPQFESYIENKTDDIKHRIHGQRIDKIESELALVSNKTDNLLDMNDDSENAVVQLHRTIKKAFQAEKIRRLNMELEMDEKIKNIEDYCVNFTRTSGQIIDEFKKEVAIENRAFTAEINKKVININNTINDHKSDVESSFGDLKNDLELELNEKIKTIDDYCVNLTISSGQLIEEFKKEVAIENIELTAEIDKKIKMNNYTVYGHIFGLASSHDYLNNRVDEVKEELSIMEDIIIKDSTDGRWSSWGSFGSCSNTCGRGVMIRSRTCTRPKPSLKGKHCEGSSVEIAVCNRNTCPDTRVFFTARGITGNSIAKFPDILENYGNGYDKDTGKFTCKYPGIYMFSFQISKQWKTFEPDYVSCIIKINSDTKVGAMADPHGDDKDGYSISVTGTFHLSLNDVVHVSNCYGLHGARTDIYSSFTGVLLVPDNI